MTMIWWWVEGCKIYKWEMMINVSMFRVWQKKINQGVDRISFKINFLNFIKYEKLNQNPATPLEVLILH